MSQSRLRINIVLGPFLSPPPAPAGAVEKRWTRMAQVFASFGHDVTVLCRDHPDLPREKIQHGVRWLRLKGATRTRSIYVDILKDWPYARRARRALPPADVTVTNTFWLPAMLRQPGHWGALNVHIARVPKGQMRLYRHAARISTVSSYIADLIKAEVPEKADIVNYINNPVDTEVFTPNREPGDSRMICFTGRVHPEKGIERLAGAVRRLRESDPRWKLLVVGHADIGLGGGGESYKREIVQAIGDEDAIEFTGGIGDPKKLADRIRSCRYYCYPSLAKMGEACPVAPMEALAAGVPPIVSELGQFRDYIEPDVNGVVVPMEPDGSEERLAKTIHELDEDPARYEQLRNRAVESAQTFAYKSVAQRYIKDWKLLATSKKTTFLQIDKAQEEPQALRITIVLGPFLPPLPGPAGAMEKLWCDLAREFVARGNEVTMVCRDHLDLPREEHHGGIRWLKIPAKARSGLIAMDIMRDLPYSKRAKELLPKADITITNCFWLPIMMRKQKHWGAINVHVQRVPKRQMRLYRHVQRISTASSHLADLIRDELPNRNKGIVRFFTNPVDTKIFHPATTPGDQRSICYTGRVHPEKGLHLLAEAVNILRKNDPKWKLNVVGHSDVSLGGGGEPYRQRIIKAAGSTDAVEFAGGIRDPEKLADLIRGSRYYCYPSLARKGEACPVAPLEALSAGVPPIVSELDQFLDYIEPNVNGLVVPMEFKGAADRLAKAIQELDEDPQRYDQLRAHAIKSAQKFSNKHVAERYIEDFKIIMNENSKTT